jgi:hypothetical protein
MLTGPDPGKTPTASLPTLMEPQIDEALAEAERAGLPDGKLIAEELIRAFAGQYQCKEPRDVRTLERLGRTASGNPLVS